MNQKIVNEIMAPFETAAPTFHKEMSDVLLRRSSISLELIERLQHEAKDLNVKIRIRKMDPYLVSDQDWELDHICSLFRLCRRKDVRAAKKEVGRSRRKIYKFLDKKFVRIKSGKPSAKNILKPRHDK